MESSLKYRKIVVYKDYFNDFFICQREKVKKKIIWTFEVIEDLQIVPEIYLKHVEGIDGLYEIRVQEGNDIFRIFCFFDEGKLIVLINGFQKKSNKTPQTEIGKALEIKKEYEQK